MFLQATGRNRKGTAMVSFLISLVVVAITILPITRWLIALSQGTGDLAERMEMRTILQEYWSRLNAASYDELQATIDAKGPSWTEDIGGRYTLTIETSDNGKFENALCNVAEAAGTGDRVCKKATITIVSKADPSLTAGVQVTRVAPLDRAAEVEKMITAQEDKFDGYYTKAAADAGYACPWDYYLAGTACVPCAFPNWKQIRNGNCSLYTCPTGWKANAAGNGCEAITCSGRTYLSGDYCYSCPLTDWKQYYVASTGCGIGYCPTGYRANAWGTGCDVITCPGGQHLEGDGCVADVSPAMQQAAQTLYNQCASVGNSWISQVGVCCQLFGISLVDRYGIRNNCKSGGNYASCVQQYSIPEIEAFLMSSCSNLAACRSDYCGFLFQ